MRPQVLIRMWDGKEFFVMTEDVTAEELVNALKIMKNGNIILYDIFMIQLTEKLPKEGVQCENEDVHDS